MSRYVYVALLSEQFVDVDLEANGMKSCGTFPHRNGWFKFVSRLENRLTGGVDSTYRERCDARPIARRLWYRPIEPELWVVEHGYSELFSDKPRFREIERNVGLAWLEAAGEVLPEAAAVGTASTPEGSNPAVVDSATTPAAAKVPAVVVVPTTGQTKPPAPASGSEAKKAGPVTVPDDLLPRSGRAMPLLQFLASQTDQKASLNAVISHLYPRIRHPGRTQTTTVKQLVRRTAGRLSDLAEKTPFRLEWKRDWSEITLTILGQTAIVT